jgi:hypothetical protein
MIDFKDESFQVDFQDAGFQRWSYFAVRLPILLRAFARKSFRYVRLFTQSRKARRRKESYSNLGHYHFQLRPHHVQKNPFSQFTRFPRKSKSPLSFGISSSSRKI